MLSALRLLRFCSPCVSSVAHWLPCLSYADTIKYNHVCPNGDSIPVFYPSEMKPKPSLLISVYFSPHRVAPLKFPHSRLLHQLLTPHSSGGPRFTPPYGGIFCLCPGCLVCSSGFWLPHPTVP